MTNIVHFGDRRKTPPVRIAIGKEPERFPSSAEAAFAAIVDHLRSAAALLAAATDSEFAEITDMARRLEQRTEDEIAVDLLVMAVEWEDQEREFLK